MKGGGGLAKLTPQEKTTLKKPSPIQFVIFSFKIRMKQEIFTINKPDILNKSKYQRCFYCFIVCKLVPCAFWFSN